MEPYFCFICDCVVPVDQIAGHEDAGVIWCEECAMMMECVEHGEWFNEP